LEDLGKDPAELFTSFSAEPVAAASISQVHHARLNSGGSFEQRHPCSDSGRCCTAAVLLADAVVQSCLQFGDPAAQLGNFFGVDAAAGFHPLFDLASNPLLQVALGGFRLLQQVINKGFPFVHRQTALFCQLLAYCLQLLTSQKRCPDPGVHHVLQHIFHTPSSLLDFLSSCPQPRLRLKIPDPMRSAQGNDSGIHSC
ncbi:hypothetical protein VU06_03595, partial [Desulfobulbus sp. F3]|nr:hypothetical protein [Desulfobulbus sp. F3]